MLKKHLKKIVSLVLVTMMAIGMSITAIAACYTWITRP